MKILSQPFKHYSSTPRPARQTAPELNRATRIFGQASADVVRFGQDESVEHFSKLITSAYNLVEEKLTPLQSLVTCNRVTLPQWGQFTYLAHLNRRASQTFITQDVFSIAIRFGTSDDAQRKFDLLTQAGDDAFHFRHLPRTRERYQQAARLLPKLPKEPKYKYQMAVGLNAFRQGILLAASYHDPTRAFKKMVKAFRCIQTDFSTYNISTQETRYARQNMLAALHFSILATWNNFDAIPNAGKLFRQLTQELSAVHQQIGATSPYCDLIRTHPVILFRIRTAEASCQKAS